MLTGNHKFLSQGGTVLTVVHAQMHFFQLSHDMTA